MIALFKIIINQMICAKMKPCMHNSEIARIFNLEIIKSVIIYCYFMIAVYLNHNQFHTKISKNHLENLFLLKFFIILLEKTIKDINFDVPIIFN